ncbi:hypothetical protein PI125_g21786 [Phytophthora idaei]|nr:hypothetical protein PI125_g21786 [Phytophthora idaei]
MIIRSRTCHIDETTNPEETGACKKQVVASYEVGTKRQRMTQERPETNDQQLGIYEGGQVMAATEGVPKSHVEAITDADSDEWKKPIASELGSLTANKTWKLVLRPAHQRPIGCRWVFALKRDERASYLTQGTSRSEGILCKSMASTAKRRNHRWLT